MADWIGSSIEGGAGIIGSLINWGVQKDLQGRQNQYNLDMWNLQNEYNSPQAQMKRYEEAGLNPALIAGQITPGLSSSAPVKSTPQAPDVSKDMRNLAQAFNLEGLKTQIANRKEAQANARIAQANADDRESDLYAQRRLYWDYDFDPFTGQFVYVGGVSRQRNGDVVAKDVLPRYQMYGEGKLMQILSNNYRTNFLLNARQNLINSQRGLNLIRGNWYQPQILMQRYQQKYYPWQFWIGNVKTGVQAGAQAVGTFYNP